MFLRCLFVFAFMLVGCNREPEPSMPPTACQESFANLLDRYPSGPVPEAEMDLVRLRCLHTVADGLRRLELVADHLEPGVEHHFSSMEEASDFLNSHHP